MDTLLFAEEIGDCHVMRRLINAGDEVANNPDFASYKERYASIRTRLEEVIAYEDIHGSGTRLKRDHPFNARLVEVRSAN
jgi:hypothetical protein